MYQITNHMFCKNYNSGKIIMDQTKSCYTITANENC